MNCVAEISTENSMLTSYQSKHQCSLSAESATCQIYVYKINKWPISYILHPKVQM